VSEEQSSQWQDDQRLTIAGLPSSGVRIWWGRSNSESISEENIPLSDYQASHALPIDPPVGSGTAAVAAIDSGAWGVVGDTAGGDAPSYPPLAAAGRPAGCSHRFRMTDCQDWLTELTHAADRILNEDLAALQRMPELARLDRYESITRDEEALRWEFTKECNGFLTSSEEDRLRGELRLARLLLAASFYAEGEVPESIADDFIEPELEAVIDFDRFKRFDTLDESQLEARIQRLDGEVTELLETYADSTVANIDALLENPDVQQDVIDRLLDRYEERRERVRQAIFLYAETHGLDTLGGDLALDDVEPPAENGGRPTGAAGGAGAAALAADASNQSADSTGRSTADTASAAATAGGDTVTAATARLFELDYLGRFETSMQEADVINLPDGSFSVPDGYWEGRCSRRNERDRMADLLETNGDDVAAHPVNPTARYAITDSKYFGLTSEMRMVIEATVYSHLTQHAREGVDATPAGVDDLVAIVGAAVDEAADRSAPSLLGIASPTGWTDRVVGHVQDDELSRTHYGPHVSVCLIDLQRGDLIYDTTDSVVTENADLFERAVQADAVADCVDTLRSQYLEGLGRETLLLTAATEETGYDRHVVRQAFSRLEADDDGEVFSIDDGVAFEFR